MFDESKSLYSLPSPTPDESIPIAEDEASDADPILEEILISFWVSGSPEEQMDMPTSDEDSDVQSL